MMVVIKHRSVTGVYLCHEGQHWYWGPREHAQEYSINEVAKLLRAFPKWEEFLGCPSQEALVEVDRTPETVAPPAR